MIQDYEQPNRQKSNDSRQNNRKAFSGEFTSSSPLENDNLFQSLG